MEVVVDGVVYQYQLHGGVTRLYSEILPRMCDLDGLLRITLLTTGRCRQALPTHPSIHYHPLFPVDDLLRPRRLWWPVLQWVRELVEGSWTGNAKGHIWHSTYYTMLERWSGPTVVTVLDMVHERFQNFFNGLLNDWFRTKKRRCVLAADAVICISETTKKDVQQFYGIDAAKIRIVPLAHSHVFRFLESGGYSPKPPTDKPFLLYVGDRSHYKNFGALLQAYSSWPRQKEVGLVIVGKKWSRREVQHLAKLGITDRAHLLREVDDQWLCLLYNQASALVYPSLYEGFGIPLLEAMACGCPIIASRIPSTLEVAGECPIYFEPTEAEDLLAAFDIALSEGRDSERVQSGLERVKCYSWDKTAKQTLEVYRALSNPD